MASWYRRHLFLQSVVATVSLLFLGTTSNRNSNLYCQEAVSSSEHKAVVSGKVLGVDKAPIEGAKVTLYHWQSPTGRWGHFHSRGQPITTSKSGEFRFAGLSNDYYFVSIEAPGFARAFHDAYIDEQRSLNSDVVMLSPAVATIRVVDEQGKPIAGARVREYRLRGVNGEIRFPQMFLDTLGVVINPSDEKGVLRLPALPAGDTLNRLTIERENYAPVRVPDLEVADGAEARVTMKPGLDIVFRVPPENAPGHITTAAVDVRFEEKESPSELYHYEMKFDSSGVGRLNLGRGNCNWLLLQHKDFFITPVYSAGYLKNMLKFEPERNRELTFQVHPKVKARGRVIDADTGKPVAGTSIQGELANGPTPGWDDAPPDPWSFAGWAETDKNGEYSIELTAGKARVSHQDTQRIPEHDYYELNVAADGSTVIPDIKLRSIPKVTGTVRNPDGTPAVRAVVRVRGKGFATLQPVLTDAAGRFELQPDFVPVDAATEKRAWMQDVVAFDPYSPLAGRTVANLGQPAAIEVKLEPHEPGWLLSHYAESLTPWQRGEVPPERAAKDAAITLHNQPAPEIDAIRWINTDGKAFHWADLKGKYVLLDFWHTACGPCHQDFPSVKLVHELYGDKGVVVIGMHTNAAGLDEVQAHATKIGLPFPIAVDYPDGRTVARFQPHGIANMFPNYVLVSPDGKVLRDDQTIATPTLRGYKLEIIRQYLLESKAPSK